MVRDIKDGIMRIFGHCIFAGVFQGYPCFVISQTGRDWSADGVREMIKTNHNEKIMAIVVLNTKFQELPPLFDIGVVDGLPTEREISFGAITSWCFDLGQEEVAILEKTVAQLREKLGKPAVATDID